MHALAVGFALADDAGSDLYTGDAGLGLFFIGFQLFNHFLRDMDAGDIGIHIAAHADGFRDDDAELDRFAELFGFFHKLYELFGLIDSLGLEEVRAGGNFAFHLGQLNVYRVAAGRNDCAVCEFRWFADQFVSGKIMSLLQTFHRIQKRNGIKIENRFRLGRIAELGVVAGKGKHVLDAEGSSA